MIQNNKLTQFLLLAKNAHGAAASHLIRQATEYPGLFVFGELLEYPGIKELENNSSYTKDWKLLQLFAFGTLDDYAANRDSFDELSEKQLQKLRLLTVASLASKTASVSYDLLQQKLNIDNLRQLEDLIIEAMYADVLKGKLNPKERKLEVEFVVGRDIRENRIDSMIATLDDWCTNCERCVEVLEKEIIHANQLKEQKRILSRAIDDQIEATKKTLKAQPNQVREPEPSSSGLMDRMSIPSFRGLKSHMKGGPSRIR